MIDFRFLFGVHAAALPPEGRSKARAWPRTLVMLLLGCLLLQATAAQTHVHFTGQPRLSAAAASGLVIRAGGGGGEDAADCPLCREAAMAGAYLPPPAIVLPAPPAPALWVAAASIRAFGLTSPAHSWQSRAPPQ